MTPEIRRCAIVVPARNEEELLPRCLDALAAAIAELAVHRPSVTVRTIVMLDSCTDRSAQVVAARSVEHAVTGAGNVGAARHLGCRRALGDTDVPADQVWLANTDADSAVPTDWLVEMLRDADRGVDLVLGTVVPDDDPGAKGIDEHWQYEYDHGDGHHHVHATNLGIRGSVYRAIGGFRPVPEHEDVELVEAARRSGAMVWPTGRIPVITSGRLHGRTPGGFAGWLADHQRAV